MYKGLNLALWLHAIEIVDKSLELVSQAFGKS